MPDEILIETIDQIGVARLNRPDKLNALNLATMTKLVDALERYDADPEIRCMLLAGDERAFAAGADINEMADATVVDMYLRNQFARWERIKRIQKPIVAAISGYCLGGGCELMMHCDIVIASENARFGQPEINIGVMPGAGGTQRLTRSAGKARAMDMVLTGHMISAHEALGMGLVSRVVPAEHWYREALNVSRELCTKSPLALRLAKESVLKAHETALSEGLEYERKLFYLLFATADQKEGMRAFLEKRPPVYLGK
ncbi:MAG: enoyl-CoA hydratase/isomerase family protein [Planctomycetes bacterium]|nr:enoyl-CoA hydratase/isomerase family protein [Planctomycetota bacterium]